MENNNEKKRFGRRASGGIITVTLITVAFYICLFKDVDLTWLKLYTQWIVGVYGFVVGGLTLTDLFVKK
jgi:hypothetical protein